MHHAPHMGAVQAHAKGNSSYHHAHPAGAEGFLRGLPLLLTPSCSSCWLPIMRVWCFGSLGSKGALLAAAAEAAAGCTQPVRSMNDG